MLEGLKGLLIGDLCAEHAPRGARATIGSAMTPGRSSGLFVDLFLEAHAGAPRQIVLDLDATDDPLHGHQEGRFFHGYYDCYCYLPLYVFCGAPAAAKLRRSNIDASAGAVEEVARIVARIRARWPRVEILLRGGLRLLPREALMGWCEAQPRRLRLRARPQPPPARGDRRGRSPPPRPSLATGGAVPPIRRLRLADPGQLEPRAARRRQGRASGQGRQPALRGHVAAGRRHRRRRACTRSSTAPAARSKTASRSSSSTCSPIARQRRPCAPTSCGYGSPRSPTSCSTRCAIGLRHTQFATPPAAPSA